MKKELSKSNFKCSKGLLLSIPFTGGGGGLRGIEGTSDATQVLKKVEILTSLSKLWYYTYL